MKILLLDDHKIFGESLKLILEEQGDICRCDYVSNVDKFLKIIKLREYDILLIDINLKDKKTGIELVEEILREKPKQNIIILTSYDLDNYQEIAFKLGVKDFINKSVEIDELVLRIKNVNEGKIKSRSNIITDPLSKREIEVLRELIKGDNKKDIAKKLFISERTLYNHIANIYDKLRVKNIIEAYNKAMEIGYIDPVM